MAFVHHHAPDAAPAPGDICFVIQGDRLLARPEIDATVVLPDFAAVAERLGGALAAPLHLGRIDARSCWALTPTDAALAAPAGWLWHDSRAVLGVLTDVQVHALSCARQLVWWDRRHRYCGECGGATEPVVQERARRCPDCGAMFHPVAAPAIIVAVTRGEELLLAHNRNFRAGLFSLLAGFVDPGETLEQAVAREVREEVGIEVGGLRYVTSQPWPFPNSLMLGFRARWLGGELAVDGREIEEAGWFRRDALPEIPRRGTVARALIDAWVRGE